MLWTAILLGIVGSVHCALMCGPLVLATSFAGVGSRPLGQVIYHLGRIAVYTALGALFGLAGGALNLAGLQRWVSIGAGVAVLSSVIFSKRMAVKAPIFSLVNRLKSTFASLLKQRRYSAILLLGALNGLLPCGLVYAAGAGAVAAGDPIAGSSYMLAFGLGTLPMLLSIGVAGGRMHHAIVLKARKLVPASLGLMGVLLILRGLSLDIPYFSPDLSNGYVRCSACHW